MNNEIWLEKNNLGTRLESYHQARGAFQSDAPKLVYIFNSKDNIHKAFHNLSFLHVASDSEKWISTEVLYFGFYEVGENIFHVVFLGKDLTYELWEQIKQALKAQSGRSFDETKPTKLASDKNKQSFESNEVVFNKEYEQIKEVEGNSIKAKFTIYRANSASIAIDWLTQHIVEVPFVYIIVETPDGNYGRDIQGIYKE